MVSLAVLSILVIGWGGWWIANNTKPNSTPSEIITEISRPLDKYTIENLGKRSYGSNIILDAPTSTTAGYTVYKFHFDSDGKSVTGVAHLPNSTGPFPVLLQLRGYVDHKDYKPGMGTAPTARVFAANGYASFAPDGLGYGESDNPSGDVFEERFQTYTTALNLLAAIDKWPMTNGKIGIWGHSNGGQQAITILEITGKNYPTVLWAPVTKPFPYSILYFTDDIPDHGKALRKVTANFEKSYDVELYSLTNYLDKISAPINLHQGGIDGTVPQKWSDDFAKVLKEKNIDVNYFVYPGAGHSMEGSWNTAVQQDLDFFRSLLK